MISSHPQRGGRRVIVCAGTGCVANGSLAVHEALVRAARAAGLKVVDHRERATAVAADAVGIHFTGSGCQGFCQMGPLVTILPENVLYCKVTPEDAAEIVQTSLVGQGLVERLLYRDPASGRRCRGTDEIPFYVRQQRQVLATSAPSDPEDLASMHVAEALCRGPQSLRRNDPGTGLPGDDRQRPARSRRRRLPTGRKWDLTRCSRAPRSTSSAMATRATRGPSWTAV